MLKTITVGSCVSIQGTYVRDLSDGRIVVKVGDDQFAGLPVMPAVQATQEAMQATSI